MWNKSLLLSILITIQSLTSLAQSFSNDWVVPSQPYLKLSITETGIYRINASDITSFNSSFITRPDRIQLFHKGQEIATIVEKTGTAPNETLDYIEFYAEAIDGRSDTPLYDDPNHQPHTLYNLFTDTTAYFLTNTLSTDGLRMTSYQENPSGQSAEGYYWETKTELFNNRYNRGDKFGPSFYFDHAFFNNAEGWTGDNVQRGQSILHTLTDIDNANTSGSGPTLTVQLTGQNNLQHSVNINVNSNLWQTSTFSQRDYETTVSNIAWSDVVNGEVAVTILPQGVNGNADVVSTNYVQLRYARNFEFDTKSSSKIELEANATNKSYVVLNNVSGSEDRLFDVTSSNQPIEVRYSDLGSSIGAIIRNTSSARTLWWEQSPKSVSAISSINFSSANHTINQNSNYLIVTSQSLRASFQGEDQVNAYAEYRASTEGGGYNVQIVDFESLVDQFNYGENSPLAVKRFCEYMYQADVNKYLFIIGKGLRTAYNTFRFPNADYPNHVPTFGEPGSDVLFSEGLDGNPAYEAFATGRINALVPEDVYNYLNKVKEQESRAFNNLRQKHLILLSGGNDESELNLFKSYTENFASIASTQYVGATSSLINKNNFAAVEFINISNEVNQGATLVSFFGHSGGDHTDIEIGDASDPANGFNNEIYPAFLVNGCNAGQFYDSKRDFGTDWIITPDKGALSFFALSNFGLSRDLRNHSNIFYEVAFNELDWVSQPVGDIKKEASRRYIELFGSSESRKVQVQSLNLQGDPAVKLFGADRPDFSLDENLITFGAYGAEELNANIDSFYVDINVKNFGLSVDQSSETINLDISVERTLSSGQSITYGPFSFEPPLNQNTFRVNIDNSGLNADGINSFSINLDPSNQIEELSELNNTVNLDFFLSNGSTFNLLPENYAQVRDPNVNFFFQNLTASSKKTYTFELDSSSTFDSPLRTIRTLDAYDVGLVSIDLNERGAIPNYTVFYWRTKLTNPEPNESNDWVTSSFTYSSDFTSGWDQRKADQKAQLVSDGLQINENGIWEFLKNELSLEVECLGSSNEKPYTETKVYINNQDYFFSQFGNLACSNNRLNVLAFKRETNVPFTPITGVSKCGRDPRLFTRYTDSQLNAEETGLNAYIGALEDGDKLLLFSTGALSYQDSENWDSDVLAALDSIGVNTNIWSAINDDTPLIILGEKGAARGSARVLTGINNQVEIELNDVISGSTVENGEIMSGIIGPAQSWDKVSLSVSEVDPSDQWALSVIGIDANKNETEIVSTNDMSEINLSDVSAQLYPNIRLQLQIEDPINFTPPQLNDWTVDYTKFPEGVLIKSDKSDLENTNYIAAGQLWESSFTFWNISDQDINGPITIRHDLQKTNTDELMIDSIQVADVQAGDSVNFNIQIQSNSFLGESDLLLNANVSGQELYKINNQARYVNYINIEPDNTNPILDVLFDGIYIMNGDIVAPSPSIDISIKDLNSFINKEDTVGMHVYLREVCPECPNYQRISFSSPNVAWTPATDNTPFEINYQPNKLDDGIYGLRVEAVDGFGNDSGVQPYEINFEVINESTITNFYPYPNPFSTSTQFVFTLTGSEIPEDIKIQIMTVSGRVVREIFMYELGNIHIGHNRTDYAWDGRDEYGDQLANGVYLYRVLIKNPGEDFKHRQTSGDKAFKNGYGKLYLLR